jgi:hypothetical protein
MPLVLRRAPGSMRAIIDSEAWHSLWARLARNQELGSSADPLRHALSLAFRTRLGAARGVA